jgi:hypothetical protein
MDRRQGLGGAVGVGLQRVDPQVDRRAFGERLHFDGLIGPEGPDQTLFQPVWIVTGDRRRGVA